MIDLKDKRVLIMAGGGALVLIIALWFGFRALFGSKGAEDLSASDAKIDGKSKGEWVFAAIPDLPPLAFNPRKDWGADAVQLAQVSAVAQGKVKGGVRVERNKSPAFNPILIEVEQIQVDKNLPDLPRIQVRMNYTGNRILESARMDILFLDNKATVLGRRAVNPLVISGGLYGDRVKPLHPGEVRTFFADATQAPLGWMDQVSAELVHYQFAP